MAQTANNMSAREYVLARRKAMSTTGKAALNAAASGNQARAPRPAAAAPKAAAARPAPVPATRGVGRATPSSSSRAASMARRLAMSSGGKAAVQSKDRVRDAQTVQSAPAAQPAQAAQSTEQPKKGCGCGCDGTRAECKTRMRKADKPMSSAAVRSAKQHVSRSPGRAASLARREAMSTRGKAGVGKNGMSAAQTARAGNPNLSSRDLAKILREQRSKNGGVGQKKSQPCGRTRAKADAHPGGAQDAPWKVGASETVRGQIVTGTMVGRSPDVTGDEPSTCRPITGTEYLGADIFKQFCQAEPVGAPRKVMLSPTSHGNSVTGNRIGRGVNVTGDEPGTCKNVTGTEYVGADQSQAYCGTAPGRAPGKVTQSQTHKGKSLTGNNVGRSEKVTGDEPGSGRVLTGTQYAPAAEIGMAPAKVGRSATLRGGAVTGTLVGRSTRMTGDEPGSCRNVTGDDYIGQEQYGEFCESVPKPTDQKIGVSATPKGLAVTGTMTGRASKVTGDEPGTCKAITGTPYAGVEQYQGFCETTDRAMAKVRNRQLRSTPGPSMTGLQPGLGGVMTGDRKGACEPLTGTPYVGADQFADACPATPADSASPDFPQPMSPVPWQQFSISPPAGAASAAGSTGVTGNRYEQGHITGPFGMAPGKVTGTEEARFGHKNVQAEELRPTPIGEVDGRVKSRITGEGMDAGLTITGDDWDRGSNITGTEGMSAVRRNPTRRAAGAPSNAMAMAQKRNEEVAAPVSKVTGGSGNTDRGALITYSGGARG